MTKKITIYGLDPEAMARDVANALQQNFGGMLGVRIEIEDMTREEETERMRAIMLAGPNEIFGRASSNTFGDKPENWIREKTDEEKLDEAWATNGQDIPPEEFMPVDLNDEREMRL